jgi:hypothetical protein
VKESAISIPLVFLSLSMLIVIIMDLTRKENAKTPDSIRNNPISKLTRTATKILSVTLLFRESPEAIRGQQ